MKYFFLFLISIAFMSCEQDIKKDSLGTESEQVNYKVIDEICVEDNLSITGTLGIPQASKWESLSFIDPSGVFEYIRGTFSGCQISILYLQSRKETITWSDVSSELGQSFSTAQQAIDYFDNVSDLSTYQSFLDYNDIGDIGTNISVNNFYSVTQGNTLDFNTLSYQVNDSGNCCP